MIQSIKDQLFPKGIRRFLNNKKNYYFRRVTSKAFIRDLENIGLKGGDLVCVHSALGELGYIVGGTHTIIESLSQIVGEAGTIMMPTFTSGNDTYTYAMNGPGDFDPEISQVTTGRLAEDFRKLYGVVRSIHPTHSVAAKGPLANELTKDHDKSLTPFGPGTPYDRLVALNGKILLLNTNGNSILHKIEEDINWPNSYMDQVFELPVNWRGKRYHVKTLVHTPGAGFVLLQGKNRNEYIRIQNPDYAFPFLIDEKTVPDYYKIDEDVFHELDKRMHWFLEKGIIRKGRVGFGEGALIDARPFAEKISKDLQEHLKRDRNLYMRQK